MAHRTYRAIYSFVAKDTPDPCIEEGDILTVRPLPNGEWPEPDSEMTGTNTRTGITVVFPALCVEYVSDCNAESVNGSSSPADSTETEHSDGVNETDTKVSKEKGDVCGDSGVEEELNSLLQRISEDVSADTDNIEGNNQHIASRTVPETVAQSDNLCRHAMEIIMEYHGLEAGKGKLNLTKDAEILNELIRQSRNERVKIGVVGGYNSGKSTLINGILGCKYLPEAEKAETAVSIYIEHDANVKCPRLSLDGKDYYGQKEILSQLSGLNEAARFWTPETKSQLEEHIVLKANVPLLSCPPELMSDCTIYLVDNPGLGELNQVAIRLAEIAVATSSAYIYTMDCETIEQKGHTDALKALLEIDKDLLQTGRLVMVVTKCDRYYEREGASSGPNERMRIKELVCETFESSLGVDVPDENVIPISGMWQSWAARYETLDCKTRRKADCCAQNYIDSMDEGKKPSDNCAALKDGSNFACLQEKIAIMVQNCLNYFKTQMKTKSLNELNYAATQLDAYKDALESEINEQSEYLRKVQEKCDQMKQVAQSINASSSDWQSRLKESLPGAFEKDTQTIKDDLFDNAEEKFQTLKINCKQKAKIGRYLVREFLTDFKSLLSEVNSHAMSQIRHQQYGSMYDLYSSACDCIHSKFKELHQVASLACDKDPNASDLDNVTVDIKSACQRQITDLPYDQISTTCVTNQPIQKVNTQDAVNALLCLRGFIGCLLPNEISGGNAFPSTSGEADPEDKAVLTHRLKRRQIESLLNENDDAVSKELRSFVGAIQSQFSQYFSDRFGKYASDHWKNVFDIWKTRLIAVCVNVKNKKKQLMELHKSLEKVTELSTYLQALIRHIQCNHNMESSIQRRSYIEDGFPLDECHGVPLYSSN